MGILKSNKPSKPTATTAKRRSVQADFANLKPLKPGGALGFGKFRDGNDPRDTSKNNGLDAMESDDEDSVAPDKSVKPDDLESEDYKHHLLSPEDAKKQGELAEGVKKIKVCSTNTLNHSTRFRCCCNMEQRALSFASSIEINTKFTDMYSSLNANIPLSHPTHLPPPPRPTAASLLPAITPHLATHLLFF